MKHTPGPWKIARDNYGVERIWDKDMDCDVACCAGDGSIPLEVREANARLIAAAPELLEALKEIAQGRGRFSQDHFEHARNTIEDMKELANKAIAIVEG